MLLFILEAGSVTGNVLAIMSHQLNAVGIGCGFGSNFGFLKIASPTPPIGVVFEKYETLHVFFLNFPNFSDP